MTYEEREVIIKQFVDGTLETMTSKGKAYSGVEDVNSNFKKVAEALALTKYQVWGIYAKKHLDAIYNAIKDNPSAPVEKTENMTGRITDAVNYLLILKTLLEEDGLG